jgi:hypothetical protein
MKHEQEIIELLRYIDSGARRLRQNDVFNGKNPKNFVLSTASRVKTANRRLAELLRNELPDLPEIKWTQRRS